MKPGPITCRHKNEYARQASSPMTAYTTKSEKQQPSSRPQLNPAISLWVRLLPMLTITAAALLAYSNTFDASFHFDDADVNY